MQIEIFEPAQGTQLTPVRWNYEELKQTITAGLAKYENMIYTPETVSVAKKDRADLNRLMKAINDEKIRVKKMYLEPFEEFERQAKELIAMIDEQAKSVDSAVKEFETAEKNEKQKAINGIYEEVIGDLKDLVPYDRIHDPKWLNKGTTLAKVREAIETIVARTKTAFTAINTMELDESKSNRVKTAYLKRFELADAIDEKNRIEEEDKRLKEYEARKAAEKAKKEAVQAEKEDRKENVPQPEEKPSEAEITPQNDEEPKRLEFYVMVTPSQAQALAEFLRNNRIAYGRITNTK